jgi:KUP system potassium uptake protein
MAALGIGSDVQETPPSTTTHNDNHHASRRITAGALLGVLGVVYGDIGTSPLYAVKASLTPFVEHGIRPAEVLGVMSLIFWSLVLVVTVKYITLVLRADNRGEGGILALMALAQRNASGATLRGVLALIGIAGACLFFGDGTITPAISILSAVEGLQVTLPNLAHVVLPLSVAIVVVLFASQRWGTHSIGRVFGPVMTLWFLAIGLLGAVEVARHPAVLAAISPTYGLMLCLEHKFLAFVVLGAVVLCVTGAEALYADMGHFGREPIQAAWLFFVLPCLLLNYFGQCALILNDRAAIENPFFLLAPPSLRLPLVVLATAATVIACQAMISGAYSVARQCMQLGFLPRMAIRHTSSVEEGQIYVPRINTMLAVGAVVLMLSFRTSDNLAAAYGIAVTGTFLCTTTLAVLVFRRQYKWSRLAAVGVFGGFCVVDGAFFVANLLKVHEGGWVPLVIGIALTGTMTSWKRGRDLLLARWKQDSMPLAPFLARLPNSRTVRVPGLAVFLTGNQDYVPTSLLHNLKHNKVLHERVVFVTVQTEDVPETPAERRSRIEELSPGINRVILRYGFMESPNIPRELESLGARIGFDPMQASYFLGREVLVPGMEPKLSWWRRWLFLAMARNALPATEFFRIPSDRVVELGVRIAI